MRNVSKFALASLVLALAASGAQAQDKKAEGKKDEPKKEAAGKNPVIEIKTNQGLVKAELFADKAPGTVKNFLEYVDAKHYDGTIFHRVIANFMVQGGGFTKDMSEKPTKGGIKNESFNGLKNETGTLAMARTPAPDSATAQFYINAKDNRFLDKDQASDGFGYCVFGKVTEGLDIVKKIEGAATGMDPKTGMRDVPKTPIVIESIRRAK